MSGQIWLHSDWHWRHRKTYNFTYKDSVGVERRVRDRFATMEEGDAYIEQRIRDMVKENDKLYFLGDLTMFRENEYGLEFAQLISSLPGRKWFIPGNHDHLKGRWYLEAGLHRIRGAAMVDGYLLTHYPVHASAINGKGNIHGHTHQHPDLWPQRLPDGRVVAWLNVSVERTAYEPIPIEMAASLLEACKAAVDVPRPVPKDVNGVEMNSGE